MSFLDNLRRASPGGMNPPAATPTQRLPDPREKLQEIRNDPNVLRQGGFNFPQNMTDGNEILNYLIQTNQVNPALLRNPLVRRAASMLSGRR